ncbi:hypothetical protein J6590_046927 [Homalodisca vitripennis]|nr:hypothetical protein J6590_046927 [Homalodisca vitripennis]
MEVPASTGPLLVDDTVHRVRGHEFRLRPVSDSQVEECVRGMRGGSAPGMDGLPVALLKQQINDTAILFERRSWEEVYRVAAGELALVKRWFDENILTMNVSKTKCMPISLRSAGEPPVDMGLVLHSCGDTNSGSCDCWVLQRVNQYKYLGVIMDSKLKWEPHIHILLVFARSHRQEIVTPVTHRYFTRNAVSVGLQVPRVVKSYNYTNPYYTANFLLRNIPQHIRDLQVPLSAYGNLVCNWLLEVGAEHAESLLSSIY